MQHVGSTRPQKMTLTPEEKAQIDAKAQAVAAEERRKESEAEDERRRKRALVEGQEDWELWSKRGKELGLTGRDLAEYAATKGQKLPSATALGTPKVVYGKIKGREREGVQPFSFNPRDPNGYVGIDGQTYTQAQVELTGPPAPTDRLFGRSLEIAKIVEGEGFKRGTTEYDQRFGQIAAADIGTSIARTQQQIGVTGYESGIGAGQGIPPANITPPIPPKPPLTAPTTASPKAKALADRDRFKSMYLDSVLNNVTASGPGKVGQMKGREYLRGDLNLDPATFSAVIAGDKAEVKAMVETVERKIAVERVNNVLSLVGDRVISNAQQVVNTGSPWLTKPWRKIERGATGDPNLEQFLVSMNEFQRQYTTLTAGGALSRAMLPEGMGEKVDAILDPNATVKEIIALVGEVKRFGKIEQAGFKQTADNIVAKILQDVGGKPKPGAAAPTPTPTPTTQPRNEKDPLGVL